MNPNLLCGANQTNSKFPISQCTPMFQCPEMLDENMDEALILREAPKIDIWSSGVTLYQLTTGDLPFKGSTIHQIFEHIRSDVENIHMPSFVDNNLSSLLRGMLTRDPVQRCALLIPVLKLKKNMKKSNKKLKKNKILKWQVFFEIRSKDVALN